MEPDAALPQQTLLAIIAVQQEIVQAEPAPDRVMDVVVRSAARLTSADAAVVELYEDDAMVYRAACGTAADHIGLRLDPQHSLSGLCVIEDRTLRADDCEVDPRVDREACRVVGARSMMVTPLRHHGLPIGVLKVFSSRLGAFDDKAAAVLQLLVGIISAVLHRAREHEGLALRALQDTLTGLPNRQRLESAIESSVAASRPFALVFLDLDRFKRVNDEGGHATGDRVLQAVAHRLTSSIRDGDLAARFGGDEFVLLLDGVRSDEAATETVHRLRRRLEEPIVDGELRFSISASAGVALYPVHGSSIAALLAHADARMYAQKSGS
jgi:diguanylate cyclase (GGDEF)-like protein